MAILCCKIYCLILMGSIHQNQRIRHQRTSTLNCITITITARNIIYTLLKILKRNLSKSESFQKSF